MKGNARRKLRPGSFKPGSSWPQDSSYFLAFASAFYLVAL